MKDDIDKINEQIDSILNSGLKEEEKKENPSSSESSGDTKKIDHIQDLKEDNLKIEEPSIISDEEEKTVSEEEYTKKIEVSKEEALDNSFSAEVLEEKSSNRKKIFIMFGVFLFIVFIILLFAFLGKDRKNKVEEPVEEDIRTVLKKYGDALTGVISLYYDKKEILLTYEEASELVVFDYDVVCSEHVINDDGSIYLNQCMVDGEEVSSSYGEKKEKKPVVLEGNVRVYVFQDSGEATFIEPKDGSKYDTYAVEIDEKYYDLSFLNAKTSDYIYYTTGEFDYGEVGHLVNYKTGKKALEDLSYQSILPIRLDGEFDTKYAAVQIQDKWGFYNIINNKRTIDAQYTSVSPTLSYGITGPILIAEAIEKNKIPVYIWDSTSGYYGDSKFGVVDYTNGKYSVPLECQNMLSSGSYLWCVKDDGQGVIYDYSGNKYLNNKYDRLYGTVDGKYVMVQDKTHVKLVDFKGNVLYDYGKYSFKKANYFLSYDNGVLFQFTNSSLGDDYDYDMDDSCIEFIYYGTTKKGEVKNTYCGGIAKPILYLYPEEKTTVKISFEHPEFLETTYPKFVHEWVVEAYPNGDLYDQNGKYYYALYWDEKKTHLVDFQEGFYVEKENAISFLEEKLDEIGLNPKEKNEFIMYWLPILEKNEKNLVYFELTEERESVNRIHISPKPDSLLRLVIHVKKVDKKTKIKKQKLTHFEREGFTVVEWGGTTY